MDKQDFIGRVKVTSALCMQQYNILTSLTIAQAILESGWGESQLTRIANNLFGIKRWGYPSYVTMSTREYVNGEYVTVQTDFRKYNSWNDSIIDHAKFLIENSRYKNIIGVKDANKVCDLIQADGYATDPNYSATLKQLISENNLVRFDGMVPESNIIDLQHNLNRLFNSNLVEDGILGPLTQGAMNSASKVFGVYGQDNLLTATKSVLSFPTDSVPSPHEEYPTRYIQYRCGRGGDKPGVFWYGTMGCVQNFQASHGLVHDGVVGPLTWAALMK